MLIDIPVQMNCSYCPFREEGSGWCLLGEALDPKGNWRATEYSNEGCKLNRDEECRPDWCPFKKVIII